MQLVNRYYLESIVAYLVQATYCVKVDAIFKAWPCHGGKGAA